MKSEGMKNELTNPVLEVIVTFCSPLATEMPAEHGLKHRLEELSHFVWHKLMFHAWCRYIFQC